jgi:histone-lysine N-methyltransferase SETD3
VNDGRPNGELLLSTGTLQDGNMSDCLYFPASLIAADRCGALLPMVTSSCSCWPCC